VTTTRARGFQFLELAAAQTGQIGAHGYDLIIVVVNIIVLVPFLGQFVLCVCDTGEAVNGAVEAGRANYACLATIVLIGLNETDIYIF
jgi:hypothetical protein